MGFILPRIQKCCCCLSLRFGSLIIGYVCIVFSALSLSGTSYSLYRVVKYVNSHNATADPHHDADQFQLMAISEYISHAYLIFVFLYYFIISILLVVGVHLNKTLLIRYYFKSCVLLFCLALVAVILSTVYLHFVATVTLLKWSLLIFFCLIVVRSTYLEMEEKNKPREFEMQNLYNPLRAPILI